MFDDYAKRLEKLGADVPKIFKMVAKKGAVHAENTAKEITSKEKLVDTGAYRRSWNGENIKTENDVYGITLQNDMEYASFLEDGYDVKTQHFVPFDKMEGSPKANKLISEFQAKYPNAKGFIAKPRRFKGRKVGRKTMNDLEGWALLELRNEIEIAMMQKEHGLSRSEAKKYLK